MTGDRFVRSWYDAMGGDRTPSAPVVVFEAWQSFAATFSEARITTLNHLSATRRAGSVGAPAVVLSLPYRQVDDDVTALLAVGLLELTGTRLGLVVSGAVASGGIDVTPSAT